MPSESAGRTGPVARAGRVQHKPGTDALLLDCDHCVARHVACGDCVVSALIGTLSVDDTDSQQRWRLDAEDRRVLAVLVAGGLIADAAVPAGA